MVAPCATARSIWPSRPALVPEDAEHDPLDRLLDIAVGEDYEGRLVAEFQADALYILRSGGLDARSDRAGPGEGNLVDLRMLD